MTATIIVASNKVIFFPLLFFDKSANVLNFFFFNDRNIHLTAVKTIEVFKAETAQTDL